MSDNLMDMDEFRAEIAKCTACTLCRHRKQVVFGEGLLETPKIMLVGEGPGAEEDEQGKPFVGKCGEKLDKILEYVGVTRDEVFITNSVLCRPPNNRDPQFEEIEACRDRLLYQIGVIQPQLIVTLGRSAYAALAGVELKGALKRHTGQLLDICLEGPDKKPKIIPFVATYHPSYLLRRGRKGSIEVLPHWNLVKEIINA